MQNLAQAKGFKGTLRHGLLKKCVRNETFRPDRQNSDWGKVFEEARCGNAGQVPSGFQHIDNFLLELQQHRLRFPITPIAQQKVPVRTGRGRCYVSTYSPAIYEADAFRTRPKQKRQGYVTISQPAGTKSA